MQSTGVRVRRGRWRYTEDDGLGRMRTGAVGQKAEFRSKSGEGVMWVGPSHLTRDLSPVPSTQDFCPADVTQGKYFWLMLNQPFSKGCGEPHGDNRDRSIVVAGALPLPPTSVSHSSSLHPVLYFSFVPQSHDKSCS